MGTRVLTTSLDATARIWRIDGQAEPLVLRGHRFYLAQAAFSPDGTRALTVSGDHTVRVWRLDGGGEPSFLHEEKLPLVERSTVSPDGARVVSLRDDDTVLISQERWTR